VDLGPFLLGEPPPAVSPEVADELAGLGEGEAGVDGELDDEERGQVLLFELPTASHPAGARDEAHLLVVPDGRCRQARAFRHLCDEHPRFSLT
jgi:mono/diheme cytochrome c family protein